MSCRSKTLTSFWLSYVVFCPIKQRFVVVVVVVVVVTFLFLLVVVVFFLTFYVSGVRIFHSLCCIVSLVHHLLTASFDSTSTCINLTNH